MHSRAGDSSEIKFPVSDLLGYVDEWNLDGQLRQHTSQSNLFRKFRLEKFFWFIEHRSFDAVGSTELKQFFHYCANGHLEPGGRWGNPKLTKPMRPISIHGYYRILKALFNYLVAEEVIDVNPMQRIKPPSARTEIKQPVADDHIQNLLRAAKRSPYSRRDTAMVLLLVDTGLRASELCGLKMQDFSSESRSLRVLGKGNKYRTVYLGLATSKALMSYLRNKNRLPSAPIFLSHTHKAFTGSGVFQMIKRLSRSAGIPNPGVHALRRTFAVNMLRAGANVFTVQTLMGHSDLTMTRRYCRIADADCEEQHRKFSPADQLTSRSR